VGAPFHSWGSELLQRSAESVFAHEPELSSLLAPGYFCVKKWVIVFVSILDSFIVLDKLFILRSLFKLRHRLNKSDLSKLCNGCIGMSWRHTERVYILVTLWVCISEMLRSNLGRDPDCPQFFLVFPQYLQVHAFVTALLQENGLLPDPYQFTIHWSAYHLTLILLMWRIWWAHNNASKWQMEFNSALKGLTLPIIFFEQDPIK